ncbi:hypothetical protein Ancab_034823 [Ancistrocladus abbreviatus]
MVWDWMNNNLVNELFSWQHEAATPPSSSSPPSNDPVAYPPPPAPPMRNRNRIYCTRLDWSKDGKTLFTGYTDGMIRSINGELALAEVIPVLQGVVVGASKVHGYGVLEVPGGGDRKLALGKKNDILDEGRMTGGVLEGVAMRGCGVDGCVGGVISRSELRDIAEAAEDTRVAKYSNGHHYQTQI